MTQFAPSLFATGFLSGMLFFDDYYPGNTADVCIVIEVSIEHVQSIHAIVDTGAPWCVFNPEILSWSINGHPSYLSEERLLIRGTIYSGKLLRVMLGLKAVYGANLSVEATVFVPTLAPGEAWNLPNFVGLDGFLHRLRFAVDPTENAFYFGRV